MTNKIYCEYNILNNTEIMLIEGPISNDDKIYKINKEGELFEVIEEDDKVVTTIAPKIFTEVIKAFYPFYNISNSILFLDIVFFQLEFNNGKLIKFNKLDEK